MTLTNLFRRLFKNKEKETGIKYSKVIIVQSLTDVPKDPGSNIYIIRNNNYDKWVAFKCPNNCGARIEVNLMKTKYPYWKLKIRKNKISLSPSIDAKDCGAHFWLEDNKVLWAKYAGD